MSSHAGPDNTYGNIKWRFSNITQEDVVEFIKTCPACRSKNVINPNPGILSVTGRPRKPNNQGSVEHLRCRWGTSLYRMGCCSPRQS
eukprot:scaffold15175_cov82-Cyclotella_meneghiniana.AAC.1